MVTKIIIEIDGEEKSFTQEEAFKLYLDLKGMFTRGADRASTYTLSPITTDQITYIGTGPTCSTTYTT